MKITGKHKRVLSSDFIQRYSHSSIYFGVQIANQRIQTLKKIGFQEIEHGETVLPLPIGKITEFNANGRQIIDKGKPMETVYHMVEWEHEEWQGRDTRTETSYIERPYKRYPRILESPPAKELSLFITKGKKLVISEKLDISETNSDETLHYLNLFLEIFGECDVYDENLEINIKNLKKVNWTVLPKGNLSLEILKGTIDPIISRLKDQKQRVIWHRIDVIQQNNPDFIAIGQAGFTGYIIFAFPEKRIFVLESLFEGNATYVFDEKWEYLSKKTKSEILSKSLQKDRFIHSKNWERSIRKLFR